MIYTQSDLIKMKKIALKETVEFDKKLIDNSSLIKSVAPAKIEGEVLYDIDQDLISVDIDIECDVVALTSISLSEVKQHVKTTLTREYTFNPDNKELDVLPKKELNLAAEIYNEIIFKIPMKIEENNDKIVKQGSNWKLCTEEELEASSSEEVDPRFAKLKEYINK